MTNAEKLSMEELNDIDNRFSMIARKIGGILIVDPSFAKSRATFNTLKEGGYLNIDVLNDLKKVPLYFKNKNEFILIIMDGDVEDNATFKMYLTLKQSNPNIPPVIFIKSEVNERLTGIFKKGGALGCLQKPMNIDDFENLLPNDKVDDTPTFSKIEAKDFAELNVIRLHGDISAKLVNEFSDHLAGAQFDLEKQCILDFSKAHKLDGSIERTLKLSAEIFKNAKKKISVYDPKNRLSKFNLEKVEGIEFI